MENLNKLFKIALTGIVLQAGITSANAATFTAVASGNFNSAATWGGVAPSANIVIDNIVIPSGITVTMTEDLTMNGLLASLNVNGTLDASANTLNLASGSLSGSGNITADSLSAGILLGITFTGDIEAEEANFNGLSLTSADITVNDTLWIGSLLNISAGSLTLGNNANVVISGGHLSTSGTGLIGSAGSYNVLYTTGTILAGAELTDSGLNNVTINVPASATVTLSDDLSMNGTLALNSGTLDLNGNNLHLGTTANIANGAGMIDADANSDITLMLNGNTGGSLVFTPTGNTVGNLTIDLGTMSNIATIGTNLIVADTLNLQTGILDLNGNDLTLNGVVVIDTNANAMIDADANSDIILALSDNTIGSLVFTPTGNTVGNLTVNLDAPTEVAGIGSDLNVAGALNLQSGLLGLDSSTVTVNVGGSATGGSNNSWVITEEDGNVILNITTGGSATFPIGTATAFAPVKVTVNPGSTGGMVSAGVHPNVYVNGTGGATLNTDQPLVNATWDVTTDAASNVNMNVQPMWSSSLETNGFDRTQAYVATSVNGDWSTGTVGVATSANGVFMLPGVNVTGTTNTLAVFGEDAVTTSVNSVVANNDFSTYPNPVVNTLYFKSPVNETASVAIYDAMGRMIKMYGIDQHNNAITVSDLPAGIYHVKYETRSFKGMQKFVKQ